MHRRDLPQIESKSPKQLIKLKVTDAFIAYYRKIMNSKNKPKVSRDFLSTLKGLAILQAGGDRNTVPMDEFIKIVISGMTPKLLDPRELHPTQSDISSSKVKEIVKNSKCKQEYFSKKEIIVSVDNYILDGHHRWAAAKTCGCMILGYTLNDNIENLIDIAWTVPGVYAANFHGIPIINL